MAQIVLENIELSAEFFGVEQMVYGGHVVTVGSSPLTGTISVQPTDPQPGDSVEVTIDIQNDSSQVQQKTECCSKAALPGWRKFSVGVFVRWRRLSEYHL